jgi:hypothetical protein
VKQQPQHLTKIRRKTMKRSIIGRRNSKPSRRRLNSRSKESLEHRMTLSQYNQKIFLQDFSCNLPGIGAPDRLRCKLSYVTTQNFANQASPAAQVFRINSLFDPDLTNTGHQPSYYDFFTNAYSKYIVLGCWCKVTLTNNATGITYQATAAISDNDSSSQTEETISEARYKIVKTLGLATSGNATQVLEFPYMPTWKIHGIPPGGMENDPNMYTATNSNPTDPAFFYIKVASSDLSTTGIVTFRAELLFDAVFKDVNPSYSS